MKNVVGFIVMAVVGALNINYCFINPPPCNGGDQFVCQCTPAAIAAGHCK